MTKTLTFILAASAALLAACDQRPIRDDGGASAPTPTPAAGPQAYFDWDTSIVDERGGGLQTEMTIGIDGAPIVAYFAPVWPDVNIPEPDPELDTDYRAFPGILAPPTADRGGIDDQNAADFDTPELSPLPSIPPIELPETNPFYELRFAKWNGSGWDVEKVAETNHARGLSLLETREGVPMIAYLDTSQQTTFELCTANRLAVAVRTAAGWKRNIVAETEQSEQPFCEGTNCLCEVVGEWPSLAQGPGATVGVAYRRARYSTETAGQINSDQLFVELTVNGSTVTPGLEQVVQSTASGGIYGALKYAPDQANRQVPHIVWASFAEYDGPPGSADGLWFARYDLDLGDWVRYEVMPGRDWLVGPQLQLEIDGSNIYVLLYGWYGEGTNAVLDLVLVRSYDRGETWDDEFIAHEGRQGSFPSMAVNGDGKLAASYYLCGDATAWLCESTNDGLMLAVREDENNWVAYVVNASYDETDGLYTALAFQGDLPFVAARSATGYGPSQAQNLTVFFGTPIEP